MSTPSKVGVIILSYNKSWILPEFFASLEAQNRKPDQVVVVDDKSTDGTQELLRAKYWRYPTVNLIVNIGQAAARNVGLKCLKTQYVLFLDGDVIMRPNMIKSMERCLDSHPEVSIAYCHYDRHGSRTDHVRSNEWDAKRLMSVNYVSMISMVRKEHLPSPAMDESLKRYEDWDLWIRMMKSGYCGKLINEPLFVAHYRKGDLSGTGESDEWRRIVEKKHGFQRERVVRR